MTKEQPSRHRKSKEDFPGPVPEAAEPNSAGSMPSTETRDVGSSPAPIPDRIGRYHLKRVIATGGMGTVYEAVQERPHRSVALKVMKRGVISPAARRRFEYESQLLARLRHPGIAQVYEAGMHDDVSGPLPYFAMEYIPNAKPITEYANQKKLGTRERLGLFTQVCEAVHHGHQKGIIHRDLKPGNLLVDAQGQVKVIDFGVARSTDSDMAATTQQTAVGQLIGTLKYMSPEQCEADPHDIDTRSDVYALGVVLYELLSGRLPYDLTATPVYEVPRVIREVSATHLSTLDKTLRGDVETIVEKALEKDRERRYQSSLALSEDIARHLNHEPILARPPSVTYRLSKFVRKRRLPLAVAAALLLTLGSAVYFQIKATWTASLLATRETAFKVLFAAQPDAALTNTSKLIADCTRAIELDPALALAYSLRGKALTMQGKNDAAWRDCTRALELDSTDSLALRTMGYLRLERGEFEGALHAYDQGIQRWLLTTDLPRDLHNRARLRRMFSQYELALEDHNRAVALARTKDSKAGTYLSRGVTRRFAGNVEGAIEDLSHAASLAPRFAQQYHCFIWEIRMLRGDPGDRVAAEAALEAAYDATTDAFDRKLVEACRGRVTADEMLSTATSDVMRCVAFYYLGARALVEDRRADAKNFFQNCRNTGVHDHAEYDLARWHLERLGNE